MTTSRGRIVLPCILAAAFSAASQSPSARAAEESTAGELRKFSDFKEALAHARPRGLTIFIAGLLTGQEDSEKLAAILNDTGLHLRSDKAVLYEYRLADETRAANFLSHFKVEASAFPVVILADPNGRPLGHKTGLLTEDDYYTFIETVAGKSAIALPSQVKLKRDIAASLAEARNEREKYRTEMRAWTLITGEQFKGAVLESTGNKVVFETEEGEYRTVPAMQLCKADFDFLKSALSAKPTKTSP